MKRFASGLLVVMACLTAPAYAIDFWHSSTVWAGQGQCSAVFSFDSGMEEIKNLQVSVNAVNKAGKKVASGLLEITQFGQSSADRYATAFLEGEEICADDLTIVVQQGHCYSRRQTNRSFEIEDPFRSRFQAFQNSRREVAKPIIPPDHSRVSGSDVRAQII